MHHSYLFTVAHQQMSVEQIISFEDPILKIEHFKRFSRQNFVKNIIDVENAQAHGIWGPCFAQTGGQHEIIPNKTDRVFLSRPLN